MKTCSILAFVTLVGCVSAQTMIMELETTGGQNDTFATAEDLIGMGNSMVVSGEVHAGGSTNSDDEWFMFDGDAGATLDVDMTITVAMGTGSTYQHNIWLYDSMERMIAAFNMSSISPSGPSIGMETFTLPAQGTYYVYVTEWSVSPNALSQPISFTPLSTRGFEVMGATPDSGRNTAGGLQTTGSLYEISIDVSSGNDPNSPMCVINQPTMGAMVGGDVAVDFDVDDPNMDPVDALFEFSTDAGMTYTACTPAAGSPNPNPITMIATPATAVGFLWDSVADGVGLVMPATVDLRITVDDGMNQRDCSVTGLTVDNRSVPVCTIVAPVIPAMESGDIDIVFDIDDPAMDPLDIAIEWSTDAGATYQSCTPTAASPQPNPILGATTPQMGLTFQWDSRADAVAMAVPQIVDLRISLDDGILQSSCTLTPLDVDNTALCSGICGDCDLNGLGPTIVDALTAAQMAAGLIQPTMVQMGCCDVDSSMAVNVLDALGMAQAAAGLPAVLVCP